MPRVEIQTPAGTAWADLDVVRDADRVLIIGHGAGGNVESPDLLAVRHSCLARGITVARITQPYRVAGKKAPPPPSVLDPAWLAVVAALRRRKAFAGKDIFFGGRSSGARVACRTATVACHSATVSEHGPVGVVALAFPVHPPGNPAKSRLDELDGVPVPVLVVAGRSDPFGMPPVAAGRQVIEVAGNHSLSQSAAEVGERVASWLAGN